MSDSGPAVPLRRKADLASVLGQVPRHSHQPGPRVLEFLLARLGMSPVFPEPQEGLRASPPREFRIHPAGVRHRPHLAAVATVKLVEFRCQPAHVPKLVTKGVTNEGIVLNRSVVAVASVSASVYNGSEVKIMPQVITPPELTLQEAAEMLNLSEAYVADLLDEAKPATQRVGKLCSLRLSDVLAFKQKSDADRLDCVSRASSRRLKNSIWVISVGPVVVLDACVLYPAPLRDLLMWLAKNRVFSALVR